jgi:hypothetical protein
MNMQRILANEPGAGAATLILALATWLGTSQAADAWSPLDLLTTQQSGALPDEATAYADPGDNGRVYRHRRLWRHVRHHRRHARPEMETRAAPAMAPTDEPTAPKTTPPPSAPPSTLQLVLTAEDGGDPFEQLMTAYYWSQLNHAMPANQIFEPAQRYAVDTKIMESPTGYIAAALMDKAANR